MTAAPAQQAAPWLTVDEVAESYPISRDVAYKRIRSGAWAGFVSQCGRKLVNREGLEAWLRAGGDLCLSDCDHRDQDAPTTGARSSRRRTARPPSAQPAASAKQRLQRLLSGGTGTPHIRAIK